MARPQVLQKLRHGRVLNQMSFPTFVETWNYIVERCDNLKGDLDVTTNFGNIKLDQTDPEHPIIRFVPNNSLNVDNKSLSCVDIPDDAVSGFSYYEVKGWGEDESITPTQDELSSFEFVARDLSGELKYVSLPELSGGGGTGYPGPWQITIDEQTGNATFQNCVAKLARAYFFFNNLSANVGGGDKMVYFVMSHTPSPQAHVYVGNYSDAPTLLGGQDANCLSASITPLYRVTNNKVACDFRYMMNVQAYDNRNFSTSMPY